jgi:hypothetical protein
VRRPAQQRHAGRGLLEHVAPAIEFAWRSRRASTTAVISLPWLNTPPTLWSALWIAVRL